MIGPRPNFVDSPYFVADPGNWHLKPGAPQDIVDEFTAYMVAMEPPTAPKITAKEIEDQLKADQNSK